MTRAVCPMIVKIQRKTTLLSAENFQHIVSNSLARVVSNAGDVHLGQGADFAIFEGRPQLMRFDEHLILTAKLILNYALKLMKSLNNGFS